MNTCVNSQAIAPERKKRANITPPYKKEDEEDPANNISVSLLPRFGKVMERGVYDELDLGL